MTEASPGARPVGGCPAEGRARGEQASGKRASGKWAALRDVADRMTYRRGGLIGAPDPAPIHVPGRTPTVLAIHGFCGVPREVAVVCSAAASRGLAAHAPLLAGHGTSPADLAPLRFDDWVASVEPLFEELTARGPVVLAGLSLGSLVAIELLLRHLRRGNGAASEEDASGASTGNGAARGAKGGAVLDGTGSDGTGSDGTGFETGAAGRVVGLVLLGNALWLARPFPGLVLSLVDALKLPDFGFPKFGTDLGDPETRRDHTTYPSQPVGGAIDVQRAGKRLRAELHRVTCPTLVLHGALDRTCPVSNAWRVAERLGTTDVQVRVLPRSRHVLTRDVERDQVRAAVAEFLARY